MCLFVTSGNELHVLLVYLYLLENRKQTYRRVVLHMRTTINTKQQQKWRVRDAAAIQIERQTRRRRLCISLFFVCTIARAERSAIRLLVLYSNDQQEGGGVRERMCQTLFIRHHCLACVPPVCFRNLPDPSHWLHNIV